jgi:hypothetical protein
MAILLTLAAVPVMAGADITESYAFWWVFTPEDNWIVEGMCGGEDVHAWGTFHDQLHEHTDAAGGHHWVNHWHARGKGVGVETGAQYIFKGGDLDPANPNHDGGSQVDSQSGLRLSSTSTRYMSLIGEGQVPDRRMRCTAHTTVNANGEMVTDFTHCVITCDQPTYGGAYGRAGLPLSGPLSASLSHPAPGPGRLAGDARNTPER